MAIQLASAKRLLLRKYAELELTPMFGTEVEVMLQPKDPFTESRLVEIARLCYNACLRHREYIEDKLNSNELFISIYPSHFDSFEKFLSAIRSVPPSDVVNHQRMIDGQGRLAISVSCCHMLMMFAYGKEQEIDIYRGYYEIDTEMVGSSIKMIRIETSINPTEPSRCIIDSYRMQDLHRRVGAICGFDVFTGKENKVGMHLSFSLLRKGVNLYVSEKQTFPMIVTDTSKDIAALLADNNETVGEVSDKVGIGAQKGWGVHVRMHGNRIETTILEGGNNLESTVVFALMAILKGYYKQCGIHDFTNPIIRADAPAFIELDSRPVSTYGAVRNPIKPFTHKKPLHLCGDTIKDVFGVPEIICPQRNCLIAH